MVAVTTQVSDPTLIALDVAMEATSNAAPRPYLGASQIGQSCKRQLWYSFHWAMPRFISAAGLRRINDGFRGEDVLIHLLRAIPGIELWTVDEDTGKQIGIEDLGGQFRGHVDGIIQGILQSPKTPHVWEAKVCNEAKVRKLEKLKLEKGEKFALEAWDSVYYAQAQIYMHYLQLPRHYLTVATPGVRDIVSCRTEYSKTAATALIAKAAEIITANRPPLKLSENPAWYECKFCDYHSLCHGASMPSVNCRTCAHSTAHLDESKQWTCDLHNRVLSVNEQRKGCPNHAYHPDLLKNHAEAIGADNKTGTIMFRRKDGTEFKNGIAGISSTELAGEKKAEPEPVKLSNEDDVLAELAADSGLLFADLKAGKVDDWGMLFDAMSGFFDRWQSEQVIIAREWLERVDMANYQAEKGTA